MIDLSSVPLPFVLIVCFLGGLLLGYAYFRALRATTDLILQGGSMMLGLGLTVGRLGILGLGFYLAVLGGALALLAALAGVLCAKALILRLTDRGRAWTRR